MDRTELSGVIIQDLGAIFTEALAAAAPTVLTADLDGVERCVQAISRQVMGRVVEQVIAARAASAAGPPACGQCGAAMRCVGRARPRRLQGLVGDDTLRRPYFVCSACHTGAAPLDAALGLDGGALSPGLSRVVGRLGLAHAFGEAADQVAETLGVTVPEEAVRRLTEGVGAVAEAEQQALVARARRGERIAPLAAAAADRPTVLLVEVDGVQAPLIDGWQEVKVSRVAPLGPGLRVDPDSGRTHLALGPSRYGVGLEPAEACWYRAYVAACQLGLGMGVPLVVLLGDGAEWIWAHARRFLALAGVELVEIVDIYHAYEHLWAVGNAVFGADTPAAAAWVEPLKDRLYREGAPAALAALAALAAPAGGAPAEPAAEAPGVPPLAPAAAEAVRLATGYFTAHAARMDYPRFVARQFPIGSGAIESACKGLVGQRAKQAGMRWSPAGLQGVLSLRALHRSGEWTAFWQTHPQRRRPPIRACPAGAAPAAPAPPAAPATSPPVVAAADPRLALLPEGRHDAPPPPPIPPPPRPLPPAPRRPAADHPWRRPLRPLRPLARSA
jgi:ribosomal protein L34E